MNSDFIVAVHALVCLHHRSITLSSDELAKNVCTNPARIRRIMTRLNKAGLVEARRGQAHGGYCQQAGQNPTLRQVAEAFDGQFVETGWHSGDEDAACPICSGMAAYTDGLYRAMNDRCMELLDTLTILDVEAQLFQSPHLR